MRAFLDANAERARQERRQRLTEAIHRRDARVHKYMRRCGGRSPECALPLL
jgi:hypothetical protein